MQGSVLVDRTRMHDMNALSYNSWYVFLSLLFFPVLSANFGSRECKGVAFEVVNQRVSAG